MRAKRILCERANLLRRLPYYPLETEKGFQLSNKTSAFAGKAQFCHRRTFPWFAIVRVNIFTTIYIELTAL